MRCALSAMAPNGHLHHGAPFAANKYGRARLPSPLTGMAEPVSLRRMQGSHMTHLLTHARPQSTPPNISSMKDDLIFMLIYHEYRQMRRKEQDRLMRMDVDYQRRKELAEFNVRREERLKVAEERTAKKRAKRQKKKLKRKEKRNKTDNGEEHHQHEDGSSGSEDSDDPDAQFRK
ncbi:hypothetical protein M5K25_016022 [Dendrobium thyrsiflorum]|uniref:PRKR-interacting protein 1 n=1 Tax=Dendrobium thyrsiflorum TaxID=117978 RepID=A0ABD0UST0_DENTH